ncbi:MAG: hypothetical protein J0H61_07260 [Alphaproteobacteria bacterium]|nr:hypothetical protein [Alphaproteobacteria bacterium]
MSSNIDNALARIAGAETHPGLAGLEDRVMSAIEGRPPSSGLAVGATLSAAAFALVLGIVSNAVPSAEARAASTLAPFGAPSPLAPSSLLLEPR